MPARSPCSRMFAVLGGRTRGPQLRRARPLGPRAARRPGAVVLVLALVGFGLKAGAGAAALLAAGGACGGALARLGADVGRHDQDRDLRAAPRARCCSARRRPGGAGRARPRAWSPACSACSGPSPSTTSSGCSPITASRTSGSSCSASARGAGARLSATRSSRCSASPARVLHTLNHALFKSLLFLGAGAVVHGDRHARHRPARRARPTRCRGPRSAFLIGVGGDRGAAAAQRLRERVAGLPGAARRRAVAREPIRLRSLRRSRGSALIGALALACFAKVCGIVFLGTAARLARPRPAHEAEPGMLAADGRPRRGLRRDRPAAGRRGAAGAAVAVGAARRARGGVDRRRRGIGRGRARIACWRSPCWR